MNMKRFLVASAALFLAAAPLAPAHATDVAVTAANVVAGSNAKFATGIAGTTITAGQTVYQDATTGKYGLADADHATAGIRAPVGIALHAASLNQPLKIQTHGTVTIGGTVVVGTAYYLSDTAGGIMPAVDVEAGDYPVFLGFGLTAATIGLNIVASGVAVP